ncbi:MAG: hypothetical protein M1831_007159 [Alyxoria varia]|nr:MAG: hypothetical protein M1831_007159 [Alyxoria varia]
MSSLDSDETMLLSSKPDSVDQQQSIQIDRQSEEITRLREELNRKDAILSNLERMNDDLQRRVHAIRVNAPSTAGRVDILETTNQTLFDENREIKAEIEKADKKVKDLLEKHHKDHSKHHYDARRSLLYQTMARRKSGAEMSDMMDMFGPVKNIRTLGVKTEIIGDSSTTKKAQEKSQELGEKIAAVVNEVLEEQYILKSTEALEDAGAELGEQLADALDKLENLRTPEPEGWENKYFL